MRSTAILLGLTALLLSTTASARTTGEFLDQCGIDEAACLTKIKDVRKSLEAPQPGKTPVKFCFPPGMSDEGFVFEVTYWIGEQSPSMDAKDENESIARALVSLYACTKPKT